MPSALSSSTPAEVARATSFFSRFHVIADNNIGCIGGLLSIFVIIYLTIALLLFYTQPFPNPKLSLDSKTTTIALSFTEKSFTVGGDITVVASNLNNGFNVFFSAVSISIFYTIKDKPTTKFLSSTDLPSMYVAGNFTEAMYTRKLYATGTRTNTISVDSRLVKFFVRISSFLSYNGTSTIFFTHPKSHLSNYFCYPLTSNVSTTTNKATTIVLAGLSC